MKYCPELKNINWERSSMFPLCRILYIFSMFMRRKMKKNNPSVLSGIIIRQQKWNVFLLWKMRLRNISGSNG
jgi:hypothetical protein